VKHRAVGQRSVYWDGCGVCSSSEGCNLTTHFMHSGTVLSVKLQDVNSRQLTMQLEVQPKMESIMTICSTMRC